MVMSDVFADTVVIQMTRAEFMKLREAVVERAEEMEEFAIEDPNADPDNELQKLASDIMQLKLPDPG